MLFNKYVNMFAATALWAFFCSNTMFSWKLMEINYLSNLVTNFNIMNMFLCYNDTTMKFFFMLFMVVTLVGSYGKIYMDHYNNKKFVMIMIMFLISMAVLTSSSNMLNFMVGWDFLGLTSVFLVMFYPNKTSTSNGILTMMYNRLGDMILIFTTAFIIANLTNFLSEAKMSICIVTLMIICASTKSAQLPLSSWLPAAMSAPTPISAMVHSSTLVTAGIFMLLSLESLVFKMNLSEILCWISMCTFMMGGLMSIYETDFKKMVAFSTMSQISMIIFMLASGLMLLSMTHMYFHAIFKTLLFCCCGTLFFSLYSNQDFKIIQHIDNKMINKVMLISVFSMTGLTYSSSFFTKDLLIEIAMSKEETLKMILFFFTGMISLMYCLKMFKKNISSKSSSKLEAGKSYNKSIWMAYAMLSATMMMIVETFLSVMEVCPIYWSDLALMNFVSLSVLFMSKPKEYLMTKVFEKISSKISFMKENMILYLKKMMSMFMNLSLSDLLIFKKSYLIKTKQEQALFFKKMGMMPSMLMMLLISIYYV